MPCFFRRLLRSHRIPLKKMAGQGAQQPHPDAFPVGVCPRSAATMACPGAQMLKRPGKPKLTALDGLRIRRPAMVRALVPRVAPRIARMMPAPTRRSAHGRCIFEYHLSGIRHIRKMKPSQDADLSMDETVSVQNEERPRIDNGAKSLRAAQYVRMSTDHQKYSIENQAAAIAAYATHRNITIVRTYADYGRSG